MTANTGRGFPYMEDTDPLADVAERLQALAVAVDDKLRIKQRYSGLATVHVNAGDSTAQEVVAFPAAFDGLPRGQLTVQGTSVYFANVLTISATDITIIVRHFSGVAASGVDVPVYWEASRS